MGEVRKTYYVRRTCPYGSARLADGMAPAERGRGQCGAHAHLFSTPTYSLHSSSTRSTPRLKRHTRQSRRCCNLYGFELRMFFSNSNMQDILNHGRILLTHIISRTRTRKRHLQPNESVRYCTRDSHDLVSSVCDGEEVLRCDDHARIGNSCLTRSRISNLSSRAGNASAGCSSRANL